MMLILTIAVCVIALAQIMLVLLSVSEIRAAEQERAHVIAYRDNSARQMATLVTEQIEAVDIMRRQAGEGSGL